MRARSVGQPLGPGDLADRLSNLTVDIEDTTVALGSEPVSGYYDGASRPTGFVTLHGGGHSGVGENVSWYPNDQRAFEKACAEVLPLEARTVGEASAIVRERDDQPYHRAAIEAALIDLALRQHETNLFALSGRPVRGVRYAWSIGAASDPLEASDLVRRSCPEARLKIDLPAEGWSDEMWSRLGSLERVVVVDFKRDGANEQLERAAHHLPTAWIEDPPLTARRVTTEAAWRDRVALDAYVSQAVDLNDPPFSPAAVNVKAPRVGGVFEALRVLEACRRLDCSAYFGGMFEVGVGRRQAHVLASLFTADAWNDLAPLPKSDDGPWPAGPIFIHHDFVGFGYSASDRSGGGGGIDSSDS